MGANKAAVWVLKWQQENVIASDVSSLAPTVRNALLRDKPPFVLSLEGPPGVGKTSFVRELMRLFGLSESQPVTSPTFSYVNEYWIGGGRYYHCDFYRGDAPLTLDEAGMDNVSPTRGIFVEWLSESKEMVIEPTHRLVIAYDANLDSRTYSFLERVVD